jgi:predicted nucleotidyltransferase
MEKRYRILDHLDRLAPRPGNREAALADARRIADYLREKYGAEVYGVGSLFLEGRTFTEKSDIDLVVKGLPPGKFVSILTAVDEMTKFPVDIVPYEDANNLMRATADEEGIRL